MAKKLDQFTFCVSDEAAIFSIVTHGNRFVCPPTWRRMTRDLLVQMAYCVRRSEKAVFLKIAFGDAFRWLIFFFFRENVSDLDQQL